MTKIDKFVLPEWTRCLPGDTFLTGRDLVEIMGYSKGKSSTTMIQHHVNKGHFPEPDFHTRNRKKQWSLGLLRKFERSHDS